MIVAQGEEAFRKAETALLAELGKRSGLIIATGGGCVTREENYPLLHQNGEIFCLSRALDKLPTEGRPLSRINSLNELFQKREPMYRRFADHMIDNDSGSIHDTAVRILEALK